MTKRKRKSDERKPIQVLLVESERAELDECSKVSGLKTSTWMRLTCLRIARMCRGDSVEAIKAMDAMLYSNSKGIV